MSKTGEITGRAIARTWKPIETAICWCTAALLAVIVAPFVAIHHLFGDKDATLADAYPNFFDSDDNYPSADGP